MHDEEAEARGAFAGGGAGAEAFEFAEEACLFCLVDSFSLILYGDYDLSIFGADGDADVPPGRAVFDGIGEKIIDAGYKPLLMSPYKGGGRGQVERQGELFGFGVEEVVIDGEPYGGRRVDGIQCDFVRRVEFG